ncbi:MAG: SpoIID/LytB domain-containing protein [Thermovirgaceae bacterium]|nr:SpoIID/LytB domain-containing protein [Thermovirgaceae bacterium]
MRKITAHSVWIFVIAFFLAASVQQAPASSAGIISVGISTGDDKAAFSAKSAPLTLTGASGESATFKSPVQVALSSSGIVSAGSAKLKLPVTIQSTGLIYWNNRPYRGHFRLVGEGRGFNVVNVIGVEDYLKGVLKMEVNPVWPMESLKAQAIIARTYAFRSRNKHGASGFDLCATDHCQVYRGVNAEDPTLSEAVDSTRGMVLKYQGSYAATFYHADSGGHTANVASVWGSSIPYLQGKPEPIQYESPYSRWLTTLRLSEIQRVLYSKDIKIGDLTALEISSTDRAGRAETITLKGTAGIVTIKSSQFRTFMGNDRIRSTFFTIVESSPSVPPQTRTISSPAVSGNEPVPLTPQDEQLLISLTQKGVFTSEELMDMLLRPERRSIHLKKALERQSGCTTLVLAAPALKAPASAGDAITFSGRGWGHGVGMSQWGAKSLAESGWDHCRILQHYFPGTSMEKVTY